ncbi:hypothetical protein U3C77_004381 [Salmonella enterica]|nr:hypothetical protein [Salmonella enterica]ELG5058753.1 hypothetical protein [Salmonella enterica]EMA4861167.1 hypothetical protein [Salmonella enterica]EMA8510810.1 hypothetical protein [Salmonella enterica]
MNTSLHPGDISRFITGRIIGSLAAGQVPWHGTGFTGACPDGRAVYRR